MKYTKCCTSINFLAGDFGWHMHDLGHWGISVHSFLYIYCVFIPHRGPSERLYNCEMIAVPVPL